jgi:DNA-directed RNA polymerase subunit A'
MSIEESVRCRIAGIKFGILSPIDIQKLSVVDITTSDTYDEDGMPIASGLMDNRMGVLEPGQACRTCFNLASRCPGHFGSIKLAVPVVHIAFVKYIYELLSVTCRNCGRLLLPEEDIARYSRLLKRISKERGEYPEALKRIIVKKASKTYECPHCKSPQVKIELVKPISFYEVSEKGRISLDPATIRSRLERIPDDDLRLLGFDPEVARPEWMIIQILPVPPLVVRPSITLESGIRSEDDLTHKLVDIVRINERIKECIESGAPTAIREELADLLQYHVTTYFDNETSGIPPARHRSGRPLRTLAQRLKGKEGRFRLNLSGKRVDFSARTVISPDPNLEIDEVGVPVEIATRLTVPEKVTVWNIEELRKLVRNGPFNHPGAVYVIRPDGRRIRLEFSDRERIAEELQVGYIVERHLKDGDIVLFNRQPSLHRMSIMAHRVKVLPYRTFRLHLAVCTPYNADFDGDEMNLHVPQSEEAQAEAKLLAEVQTQILSPRYGAPIIGATRDYLTAAYMLTRRTTMLTKDEIGKLLAAIEYTGELPPPIVEKPEPLWSGKQVFSLLLPKDFNYLGKSSVCKHKHASPEEECPDDGIIVIKDGVLVKGVIDKGAIGVEKPDTLLHVYVKKYGNEAGRVFITKLCKLLNVFISMKGFSYSLDELKLSRESEEEIYRTLNEASRRILEIIKQAEEGRLPKLPGKSLQESLEIMVMDELAKARERCDEIAESSFSMENRGVIMSRVGARGSALNIGHMSACLGQQSVRGRRVPRGLRGRSLPHFKPGDQSPEAGGFVKSSFLKGLTPTEFFFHAMGGREGLVDTAVRTQQSGYLQRRLIHALELVRVEYDGTVRDILGTIVQFKYGEDGVDPSKSDHGKAVNIARLCDELILRGVGLGEPPASEPPPDELISGFEKILPRSIINDIKDVAIRSKASRSLVSKLLEEAYRAYEEAQVEPGEAVGIVAAQSIGEPGTQMTLRTFHWAGVKERDVTLGLPRLIEIVDARRTPSTPVMTIRLADEYRHDREKAVKIAQELVYTTFKDIVSKYLLNIEGGSVEFTLNVDEMNARGVSYNLLSHRLQMKDIEFLIIPERNIVVTRYRDGRIPDEESLRVLASKILSIHIKGVKGITRVQVAEDKGEWVLLADGSNLAEVVGIEGVDPSRVETNNFFEICDVLGIEAARSAIISEIMNVFQGIGGGLDIDVRHVMLVADMMTRTGRITQIGRHGIAGQKPSPLAKAAFEITVPSIVESAVKGSLDELKGVTENIIVGQVTPIGTGFVDIYMEPLSGILSGS